MGRTYNASRFEHLCFLGDTHNILNIPDCLRTEDNSAVVLCGDAGIGFRSLDETVAFLKVINNTLRKRKIKVFVIRGNHDDPSYFNDREYKKPIDGFSNIVFLEDYSVIKHKENRILCVGGGISLDRTRRTSYDSYWPNECSFFDKASISRRLRRGKITILATHDMPSRIWDSKEFHPDMLGYRAIDPSLSVDVRVSRGAIEDVFAYLEKRNSTPTNMYYGHYHRSKEELNKLTTFTGLNVCEYKKHK